MLVPALALIYGGAVAVALSAGVSGSDLSRWTGVDEAYRRVAALDPASWSTTTSAIIAATGIVLALALLRLAWAQRLVPQRVRHAVDLEGSGPGTTTVRPRAIERAAEVAASRDPGVREAKASLGDDAMTVHLHVLDAQRLPELLQDAERSTRTALRDAGIGEDVPIQLTVTRFSAPSRTELLR